MRVARKLVKDGGVVIFDRFPQYSIPGMNDGMKLQAENKRHASLEMEAFSKISGLEPDMVFILSVAPEIAFQRKPAHKIDWIKKKHQNLLNVRFESAKTFEIDSGAPYSQVLLNVKRLIWENL
jgi:thymidylate kinase